MANGQQMWPGEALQLLKTSSACCKPSDHWHLLQSVPVTRAIQRVVRSRLRMVGDTQPLAQGQ
jgi:hypothetical protein